MIKITLVDKEPKKAEWVFPCIGRVINKGDDRIVLFHKYGCGTVLSEGGSCNIGEYSKTWNMIAFTPITDKNILIET